MLQQQRPELGPLGRGWQGGAETSEFRVEHRQAPVQSRVGASRVQRCDP